MSRMKKKWLRGGASLALVAALSLSSAMPVWAAVNTTVKKSSDKVTLNRTTDVNDSNEDHGTVDVNTGTVLDDEKSVYVTIDNPTTLAISIPKVITLTDTSTSKTANFSYNVECDLAPTQELTIAVGATKNGKFTLNNKNGSGDAVKNMTATLSNDEASLTLKGPNVNNGLRITTADARYTQALHITNDDPIYAGNWTGVLVFHVDVTPETSAKKVGDLN